MIDINIQQEKWGKEVKEAYLKWPDEDVVRFMNRTFKGQDKSTVRVLDFGCGAGRNTVALLNEGFHVYGVDYSEKCVDITKERCASMKNSKFEIKRNDNINIPIEDNVLDAVVACGSLFYSNLENRKLIMENINKSLKKNGVFWSNWRTTQDYMYKKGERVEENFYILEGNGREGLAYYFATLDELKILYNYAGFEIYNIEKIEAYRKNLSQKESWWNISARKL
ncbi:class I SAM-dependent methyltransferase [Clostridium botulinum]|uniref:class I SAM-dependent methyltransferase n=1 Tax=Clostridium botulinum TaxID=1491 RepID=UPI00052B5B09|nr:class I SAM-dependent methyltransferase [Clostridium botulinum]KGM96556.1 hypothetical protein Z956_02925 [Clostridium botulinum D str. CCUG 7971]KOC48478.1 hypothetical protein ADU88_07675 [Clostridium botulinum]NFO98718.1 class I SAM-dependent methyltransferase [Clostridium botulinum]OOV50625.1 SAM-dependent methyltransferase [Clostridium botulinum D/C]OOV55467.1 SAM-dependent methyltransferase [Clostridium botulinum D/C]